MFNVERGKRIVIPGALFLSGSSSAVRARPLLAFKAVSDYEIQFIPLASSSQLQQFVCVGLNAISYPRKRNNFETDCSSKERGAVLLKQY